MYTATPPPPVSDALRAAKRKVWILLAMACFAGIVAGFAAGRFTSGIQRVSGSEFMNHGDRIGEINTVRDVEFIGTEAGRAYLLDWSNMRFFQPEDMVIWTEVSELPPGIAKKLRAGVNPWAEVADSKEVESIAVFAPPAILGGYSFYADRKGRVIDQSVHADDQTNHGYVEDRLILEGKTDLFEQVLGALRPMDLLAYKEGRANGVPDELRLRIEVTLTNGCVLTAGKWAGDEVKVLDALLERARTAADAARKMQKPVTMPFEEKDFGAHAGLLKKE